MNRRFLELGLAGKEQFAVTKGIEAQKVGIVGLGRIGTRIAEMLEVFKPQSISYYGRHRQYDKEKTLGVKYLDLADLLKQSDIIYLCVPDEARGLIDEEEINIIKKDALLVNITHPIIRPAPLLAALKRGDLRAISDHKLSSEFDTLPFSHWYCMNNSNTITEAGSKLMSDMAVASLLNILQTGDDEYSIKLENMNAQK